MAIVAAVDFPEIPRARDDIGVGLAGNGPARKHDEVFGVDRDLGDGGADVGDCVRCDPDAALEETKLARAQEAVQFNAQRLRIDRQVEHDQPPLRVPRSRPAGQRVPAAENDQAAGFCQPHDAL